MKTAVSIPDAIFDEAERVADSLGVSRSQLYATALAEYIARNRDDNVTELLDRVYAMHSSRLDPVLESLQLLSLPKEDW